MRAIIECRLNSTIHPTSHSATYRSDIADEAMVNASPTPSDDTDF
jgi:hypothetical protein